MSAFRAVRSSEQFLCSICLEVFTNPVTTPCGHNFCKTCITQHWDTSAPCRCPMCNEVFHIKPGLKVNTLLSEMVSQLKQEAGSSEPQVAKPGTAACTVCTDPKLKAVKSCLVCLASYCDTHLQPHLTVSGLKRHQLMEPVDNLEDRMCPKHDKPLELFCRTDHSCVCMMCTILDHKHHNTVPLKEEHTHRIPSLQQTQAETKTMIEQRGLKIQKIRCILELNQKAAEKELKKVVQFCTDIVETIQKRLDVFTEMIEKKQRKNEKKAYTLIQELEQEISELEKRSYEVEQLSRSEDHLHFIQMSTSLRPAADLKDWSTISYEPIQFEGSAVSALAEVDRNVTKKFNQSSKAELKRVQKFAVDVTLDPDTAAPYLVVSKDLKQVHHTDSKKKLPKNPQRFDVCCYILGKQSFSSGRFYFEVQVKEKTDWDLGVAQESIDRKGDVTLSPRNGFWCMWLRNKEEYKGLDDPPIPLSPRCPPQKVGVFVDYSEGVVSFYDVDSTDLIYSFTGCCFKEKLLPLFSPSLNEKKANSSPLVITEVDQL